MQVFSCFSCTTFGVGAAERNGFGISGTVTNPHGQYRMVKRHMLPATAFAQDLVGPDVVGATHQTLHPSRAFINVASSTSGRSRSGGSMTMSKSTDQESYSPHNPTYISSNPSAHGHSSPYNSYAQSNNSNSGREVKSRSYLPGMLCF